MQRFNLKKLDYVILALIVAEIVIAGVIVYSEILHSTVCFFGEDQSGSTGCANVQNSLYSEILGIKVNLIGLIGSLVLFTSFILAHLKKIEYNYFLIIAGIGALFGIYFLSVQIFILKTICSSCLTVDSLAIIIFLLALARR